MAKAAGAAAMMTVAAAVAAQTVSDGGQTPGAGLDLPQNLQIYGKVDPNVRKATAIVNDAVITGTDVDQRVAMMVSLNELQTGSKIDVPANELDQLKRQTLRTIIDETLQIQEAQAQEITVSAAEIDQSYNGLARRLQRTPVQLREFLREHGSSERSLRRQIEGELAWNRLLRRRVTPFINVGDEEVKAILDRYKASQGVEEYHLKEIYLSSTPERQNEVVGTMQRMIQQMRGGAQFEALAGTYTESSTRSVGGDLGWVRLTTLPESLQQAAQRLEVGQIAGPVEVPGGFSVLYLVDKRRIGTADPRDARLSLRQLSIKFEPGVTQAQATARASDFAKTVQAINGCGGVKDAAAKIGAEVVDNDAVTIRQLPGPLQEIMLKLQVGQSTPPFGSPEEGVRALVLCGRDDPQSASLPNAEQVQAQLEEQRVNLRAQRMLRDLRRDAVVEYK